MVAKLKKITKELMVVQSNAALGAALHAKSLSQMRLFYTAIALIPAKTVVDHNTVITIPAGGMQNLFSTTLQSNYELLKRGADDLIDLFIEVDYRPNGEKGPVYDKKINVVDSCVYKPGACVELKFTPSFLPYVSNLNACFGEFTLEIISNLTSKAGFQLYRLCLGWIHFGREHEMEIAELKRLFGLVGKYKAFRDFKKNVIEPAREDVNSHTDLNVEITYFKTGKAYTDLLLVISDQRAPKKKPRRRSKKIVEGVNFNLPHGISDEQRQINKEGIRKAREAVAKAKAARLAAEAPEQGEMFSDEPLTVDAVVKAKATKAHATTAVTKLEGRINNLNISIELGNEALADLNKDLATASKLGPKQLRLNARQQSKVKALNKQIVKKKSDIKILKTTLDASMAKLSDAQKVEAAAGKEIAKLLSVRK